MELEHSKQHLLLELAQALREQAKPKTKPLPPEQEELNSLIAQRDRMKDAAAAATIAVSDMELEILRIQDDERKLRRREADDKRQLGAVTDPELRKDLKHDLYAAKSRIADLMSELQEAHNEIHALRQNADVHGARLDELERKVQAAQRAVDALPEAEAEVDWEAKITAIKTELPESALADFEHSVAENGVGAAAFNGRSCGGCFIVLPPVEAARIKNAGKDQILECPDCGCYLVNA